MTQLSNQFAQSVEKGQVDLKMSIGTISCQVYASESTALVPGQAVKLIDSTGGVPKVTAVTADTDAIFGFVNFTFKNATFPALAAVEISIENNVLYLESSAAIARGAKVMYVVTGQKVATGTNGKTLVGYAFDKATASGQFIRIFLQPFSSAAIAGQSADVGAIGVTAALTALVPTAVALNATFSDTEVEAGLLTKADNADVETLRTEVEARLDVIEAKVDGYRTALRAAGLMA